MNFYDLPLQHQEYKEEINFAIQKVFDSCQFIMGQDVFDFENELTRYLQCQNVISCGSGTDALLLALMAIDIKPGDEVITTPFTFIATAEVISLLGAKPVFADVQYDTYAIDPEKIEEKITTKTRAIIPVSLFGQTADMDEINALALKYGNHFKNKIYVIEDAAQSLGAEYKGKKSSNLSDIGCISFFPTKSLGCYGDGGAVIVQDHSLAEKIKSLRVHGQKKRYHHQYIGFNCRLDTIQAAILRVKLKYFDKELKKRYEVANHYKKLLSAHKILPPFVKSDRTSVYSQYSIKIPRRNQVMEYLKIKNISAIIYYQQPLHLQECFKYLGHMIGDFPISERLSEEIMSLPMSAYTDKVLQKRIIDSLQEVIETEDVS